MVSLIKNFNPVIDNSKNFENLILSALQKAGHNPKGYNSNQVKEMIQGKLSTNKVDEILTDMLMKGLLKNAGDWNHYLICK